MTWPELFGNAFQHLEGRLDRVLDFNRCRELWIQCELCLFLQDHGSDVRTNVSIRSMGGEADLCATKPSKMLAELKLLGNGYATKSFGGFRHQRKLERFLPKAHGERVRISREDLSIVENSFLHDCSRLSRAYDFTERYMILVVDKRGEMDSLGKALLAAQLSDHEWTWESKSKSYLVRLWRIELDPPGVANAE